MKRRVVITGMGAVTPIGNTVDETWEALLAGKNGIDFITSLDVSDLRIKIAAEVKNLEIEKHLDPKEARRIDRVIALGLIAASEAYEQAGLKNAEIDNYRFGTFVTSGIGGINTIFRQSRIALESGTDRISPFFIPGAIINLIGGNIAIKHRAKGPNLPVVTACSSGNDSIGQAFRNIRDGYLDIAFAGGAEAPIGELALGGFGNMRALCANNDPNAASIPFDKRRSGFVIGEGAGVLILEEYEHAKRRGAKILGEIIGYGATCDAFHITAPDESGEGIARAILFALEGAGIAPEDVDHINAHGTSTPYNDRLETLAIKNVFGDHAYKININSIKSMIGHCLGACGGIEAIATVLAVKNDVVPPTINYREFDEDCDLNYTPNKKVERKVNYALNNNVGFGGQNSVLVFKKYTED
ncbi:MAG: beta-ketoacyl-ACP synthase II [Bacilli bacterium]|jgi:3-oxoacyl-[acyl-carrier-protein] synthase II